MWKDQGPPTQIKHKTLTSLENRKMLPHDFFMEESNSFLLGAGPGPLISVATLDQKWNAARVNDVIALAFFLKYYRGEWWNGNKSKKNWCCWYNKHEMIPSIGAQKKTDSPHLYFGVLHKKIGIPPSTTPTYNNGRGKKTRIHCVV